MTLKGGNVPRPAPHRPVASTPCDVDPTMQALTTEEDAAACDLTGFRGNFLGIYEFKVGVCKL